MSKERGPKLLSHSIMALGGAAVGYYIQSQKSRLALAEATAAKQKAEVKTAMTEEKAAMAEEKAAKMAELAKRDPLTGLYTRRALEEAYEGLVKAASRPRSRGSEVKDSSRNGKHSLLMLDIDNFKETNDRLGHQKGDEVLRKVASIVMERTRQRDVPVRWGGEEVVVFLPRATEEDAAGIAENLRASIEQTGQAQASFGVAELDPDLSLEDNVALADQALYEAKENGRNQVITYSSLVPRNSIHLGWG